VVQIAPGEVYTALERGRGGRLRLADPWPVRPQLAEHTKFRVDPGFYNAEVSLIVNLDKWKALTQAQRAYLTKQALAFEAQNEEWGKYNAEEAQRQAKAGIQTIRFDAGHLQAVRGQGLRSGLGEHHQGEPGAWPKMKSAVLEVTARGIARSHPERSEGSAFV